MSQLVQDGKNPPVAMRWLLLMAVLVVGGPAQPARAQGIRGSPHDLAAAAGSTGASVCEFCHVPRTAGPALAVAPLWSRDSGSIGFSVYGVPPGSADSFDEGSERSGWPGASTRLCLSCHDGLRARSVLYAGPNRLGMRHTVDRRAEGRSEEPGVRGSNLIDGHPVFMPYPARGDPRFEIPPGRDGWGGESPRDVKLIGGRVECVSCHEAHDPAIKPFLRRSNAGSAMCRTCHRL